MRIAVMAGDGIGPEVVGEAVRVLDEVCALEQIDVAYSYFANSGEHYRQTGETMDSATRSSIAGHDALLFGAAGDPMLPGLMERALVLDLAKDLDLHASVRPIHLFHGRLTPLRSAQRGDIDLVIVRDSTEGEVAIPGGAIHRGSAHEAAVSISIHTRFGIERTLRYGIELARQRRGRLTVVAQANGIAAHVGWPDMVETARAEASDLEVELINGDAAAARLVLEPSSFDVIVTTLLIGGILTDLGAALVGGLGLVASARLNVATGFGMFEPAHGSAPRHTGLGVVSPIATICAVELMLRHLGHEHAATRLHAAIDQALASGAIPDATTRSGLSTSAQGDAILRELQVDRRSP